MHILRQMKLTSWNPTGSTVCWMNTALSVWRTSALYIMNTLHQIPWKLDREASKKLHSRNIQSSVDLPFLAYHTVCLETASWSPIAVVEGILRLLLLVYDLHGTGYPACSDEEAVRRHLLPIPRSGCCWETFIIGWWISIDEPLKQYG